MDADEVEGQSTLQFDMNNFSDHEEEDYTTVPPCEKTLDYFFDEETWQSFKKPLKDFSEQDMKSLVVHSLSACEQFYSIYAKVTEFRIRKRAPRYSTVDGQPTSCPFLCEAQGKRDAKWNSLGERKRAPKKLTRFHCQAQIRFKFLRVDKFWKVYYFVEEHSHSLVKPKHVAYIRSHRKIKDADRIVIAQMYNSGINQCSIMRNMVDQAGGHEAVGFLKKDLYNYVERIRREEVQDGDGDAETVLAYLEGKKVCDPTFMISYTRDTCNRLEILFWCDGKSRVYYTEFHVVVNGASSKEGSKE